MRGDVGNKALGAVVVAFIGLAYFSDNSEKHRQPPPPPVPLMAPMPYVVGMKARDARKVVKETYRLTFANAVDEASSKYETDNRCIWVDPQGKLSTSDDWTVVSTVPVAGTSFAANESLDVRLNVKRPENLWCKPYEYSGGAGGVPDISVDNDDDGESRFCSRRWWC